VTPLAPAIAALLATVAITAAIFDYRERRVPNWLTLAGLIGGVALNTFLLQTTGLWTSLKGLGIALAIYLPLYLLRGVGGGDLKLMAALGAIAGPKNWIVIMLLTSLVGGIAALILVTAQGRLRKTLHNVWTILSSLVMGRAPYRADPELDVKSPTATRLPHGVVIACAVFGFLLASTSR
jgi:prepilin peptidase CpaA